MEIAMATQLLIANADASTSQYELPEADRQAILAQAPARHPQPSEITTAEIERQRHEFISMHGCAFGTVPAVDQ